MNARKKHVIKMAHQLFIDKGFQATSIQDILEYSGISKGTFYNYFSSKNELLIAIFNTIYKDLEKERNELLIGQDPSNIEIFIKQVELQLKTNRTSKLVSLFEEVFVSNDEDLKQFIKRGHLRMLHWLFHRFIDLFGEEKRPYLLDCSIMFTGILQHNLKYDALANQSHASIHRVVRYSVERIIKMVEEVAESGDQLVQPELIESWVPVCKKLDRSFQQKLYHTVLALKKALNHNEEHTQHIELLDFIQEELLHSKSPRRFLVDSALFSIKTNQLVLGKIELEKLEQLVSDFFGQIEE
ncbi:TetR/AcrR family transcriptional regulator [Cytobacillus sp.]|uniref:TetR/AcrR family transcriptional regulator n=1 Tax=Cytobacillus sp. TaxID=2675269 RepID=UPI0028BE16B1|nr:TetR/AcrR family transcriptional regulator [Cytobacillus sp.]